MEKIACAENGIKWPKVSEMELQSKHIPKLPHKNDRCQARLCLLFNRMIVMNNGQICFIKQIGLDRKEHNKLIPNQLVLYNGNNGMCVSLMNFLSLLH